MPAPLVQNQKAALTEGDPAQYALAKLRLPQAHTLVSGANVIHTFYPDLENNPSQTIVQSYPLASIGDAESTDVLYNGSSDWRDNQPGSGQRIWCAREISEGEPSAFAISGRTPAHELTISGSFNPICGKKAPWV